MSNFDILLLAHLVGDYLFQTNWMAVNKVRQWLPLITHSMVYTLTVWVISFLGFHGLPWRACILIFICHIFLDRRNFVFFWSKHVMGLKNGEPSWLHTIADQTFHIIVLALALLV
ncbi:MAG: DUF3307 domain-containing protein [Peptococcaceae bacterium]|nr:DUF3307 domain-containing protein [Peptococcaceae bacterium]